MESLIVKGNPRILLSMLVVKEGSMGRSPKASHTALPRPKCPILPSLEGNMGHFVPYCPPWRVIWDGRPILPSLEGNMGRTSRTRKEGGGEANLVSGRAIWDAFDQNCSKMADFFRHFESLFLSDCRQTGLWT